MVNADISPNVPISLAIFSNLSYKGVNYSSPDVISSYIFPILELAPTLITTITPLPLSTRVPDKIIGLGSSCNPMFFPASFASFSFFKHLDRQSLTMGFVSPVMELSSN